MRRTWSIRPVKYFVGVFLIGLSLYNVGVSPVGQVFLNLRKAIRSVTTEEPETTTLNFQPGNSRSRVVLYNRVGKCGSRNIIYTVKKLSQMYNYTSAQSRDYDHDHPSEQEMFEEMKKISLLKPPTFYNRHIHFLDFKKYGYQEPIYINVVRDPINRFESHYNYVKYGDSEAQVKEPKVDWPDINECVMKDIGVCATNFMFYTGMYFCGFDKVCDTPSKKRVKLAKKHINENYVLIGLTEELDNTFLLLSAMLPEYFLSAISHSKKIAAVRKKTSTFKIEILSAEAKEKLRYHLMKDEYEVYYHAKRKFEDLKKKYEIY